jgi:hypothetical protein
VPDLRKETWPLSARLGRAEVESVAVGFLWFPLGMCSIPLTREAGMSIEKERRSRGGKRLPLEALVVVAGLSDQARAYECEAMDMTSKGMHLRTAYLPEVGETVSCRLDTGSGEIFAEGEVVWLQEQAKGGEFGVRFSHIDDESLLILEEFCGGFAEETEEEAPEAPDSKDIDRGTRVRLHIEGLGAPMRARVRDAQNSRIMVGSNLDFLKVGRSIDLEDVEHKQTRSVIIDRVGVELDPVSMVPQLVVALKSPGAPDEPEAQADLAEALPLSKPKASSKEKPATTRSSELKVPSSSSKREHHAAEQPVPSKLPHLEDLDPVSTAKSGSSVGDELENDEEEIDVDGEGQQGKLPILKDKARVVAGQLSSGFATLGKQARSAWVSMGTQVKDFREKQASKQHVRRTSPAPDGGLSSKGRRVVRVAVPSSGHDEDPIDMTEDVPTTKPGRKVLMAGASVLMLAMVLFLAFRPSKKTTLAKDAAAALNSAGAASTSMLARATGALTNNGNSVVANVPLFGATPLSTTEPAAPTGAPDQALGPSVNTPKLLDNPEDNKGDEKGDDKDDGKETAGGSSEYGQGKVSKPKTLRLKMDDKITEIKGQIDDKSIIIKVPGRKNIEAAGRLARRDKRLASVKAVPGDDGVTVTLAFKTDVPPFKAHIRNKLLVIELGKGSLKSSKASASNDDGESNAGSVSKKKKKRHKTTAHKSSSSGHKKKKSKKKKSKKKKSSED